MKKLLALATVSISLFAANASADTITYSAVTANSASWAQLLTLPKFNIAGATLTGAFLTFNATLSSSAGQISNPGNSGNVSADAIATVNYYANGASSSTNLGLAPGSLGLTENLFNGNLGSGNSNPLAGVNQTGSLYSALIDPNFYSSLQGIGNVLVYANGNSSINTTGGASTSGATTALNGQLAITYDYVPEPGTLALLGITLLGLGLRSKSKT
ncbi:MAG: PEP-CTERM sorting domain-containing protein [Methylococcales bacterium]